MDVINIIVPLLSAVLYSLVWFFKSVLNPEDPTKLEDFELPRLLATVAVGISIGVIGIVSGFEVTQVGIEESLLAYAFVIAGVQQFGTALYKHLNSRAE